MSHLGPVYVKLEQKDMTQWWPLQGIKKLVFYCWSWNMLMYPMERVLNPSLFKSECIYYCNIDDVLDVYHYHL